MSIRAGFGRFSIVEGQVREEGPWLGIFARRPADDDDRTLYVLVEPALPGSEDICSQLVEVMGRLFQRENRSLTGALLRSLSAAHENLLDWNRKSLREHRVGAGAGCLIMRGRTAYLAQVGPSLAYFFREGELTRLTPREPEAQGPLGLADDCHPELTSFELAPGDMLLVASSRLEAAADRATIAGVLGRGADDALAELYLLTRDFANFSALLVSCSDQPDLAPEANAPASRLSARPGPPRGQEPLGRRTSSPIDEGQDPGGPAAGHTPPGASPASSSSGAAGGRPAAVLTPRHLETASYLPGFDAAVARPSNGGNGHGRPPGAYPGQVAATEAPAGGTARPVVRLRSEGAAPRYRFQRTTTARIQRVAPPQLWVLLAAVVGFAGLLALCTLPGSRSSEGGDRFGALLDEADASYRAAVAASDPAERRALLTTVMGRLDKAEQVRPGNQELATLRADVRSDLSTLDAVVDLGEMELVADLGPLVSGDLSAQRLVLGGGSLFVLDGAGGRVLELPFDGSAATGGLQVRTVFQKGELAGAVKAGQPSFIMWSKATGPAGAGQGTLLVLDQGRRLFGYPPGGAAAPLVVRGGEEWGSLDGAAAFGGNLYVLDIASHQVWRYLPTESGFDSERSAMLGEVELDGTAELAINGDVYLLTRDGRLRRFQDSEEQPFAMAGIDRGLVGPTSLVSDGGDGLLVVDRGNKRLALFDGEGRFQRQLVSVTFTDLRSAAVDPDSRRLYVLVGDSIYAADLPSP